MNALLHWFTAPEWSQLVKTLLHSLWQGVLIAAVLALVMRRVTNPHWRYRLALLALVTIPVSGILTWAALNSPNRPLPVPVVQPAPVETAPTAAPGEKPQTKLVLLANRSPAPPPSSWTAWLALLWIVGASATLGRASVKLAGAERLRRSCQPLDNPQVTQLLAEARRAVGLARKVRVAVTDRLTSPAVVGVLVPTLVLPLSLVTTLTPEQIRFILLHELAHIRRGDYLANLFQFFIEAVLFFNPAVWWISHQVRREREACCDALAIELSGAPADYARTLVHVAESALNPSPVAAPAFGNEREPSSLADRVQRLLVPGYRPSLRLTWRAMIAAFMLGTFLLILLAEGTRVAVAQIATQSAQTDSTPNIRENPVNGHALPSSALRLNDPAATNWAPDHLRSILSKEDFEFFTFASTNKSARVELNVHSNVPPRMLEWPKIFTSERRRAIADKLNQIKLERVEFNAVPLSNVILAVSAEARRLDPEKRGVNIVINPNAASPDDGRLVDIGGSKVTINPPLTNVRLLDALNSILLTADRPLKLSIEEYAIMISIKGQETTPLFVREFNLDRANLIPGLAQTDRSSFAQGLIQMGIRLEDLASTTNMSAVVSAVRLFFFQKGVDLDPMQGKSVFYNDRKGILLVRATMDELNKVESLLQSFPSQPQANSSAATTTNASGLSTRTFKVDPNTFGKALENIAATPVTGTNITSAVRSFFATLGVELPPPKGVYYNDRAGELVVRSTKEDLDVVEAALVAANKPTPQVNIKVRFVEVERGKSGADWYLGTIGNLSTTNPMHSGVVSATISNAGPQSFTGILTDPQFRVLLRALEQRKGFSLLSEGEVTTLSGRQAQIQVVEMKTIVNGFELVRGGLEFLRKQAKEQDAAIEKAKVDLAQLRNDLQISDLDAGFTAPQPMIGTEEYKRYLAIRFEREVVYKGRLEQFQKLNKISRKELRDVLPGIQPDPTLSELINELDAADLKVKSLSNDLSKTHPEYVRVEEQRKLLNEKIDARVGGILKQLETQLAMSKSDLDHLVESVETARKLDQEKLTKCRPYYDKKRELEDMINSRRLLAREISLEETRHLPASVPNPSLPGYTATNTTSTSQYQAQVLPFGPVLDVIPTVAADGYTIQMTVIPTVTEFLGYDDPKKVLASSPVKSKDAETLPLPRMRIRQVSTSAVVWDGQTLVLGIGNDQVITKQPGGGVQKAKNPDTHQKQLLVFITPTIVDPAGNRMSPSSNRTKAASDESFTTPTNLRPIIDVPLY